MHQFHLQVKRYGESFTRISNSYIATQTRKFANYLFELWAFLLQKFVIQSILLRDRMYREIAMKLA